MKVTITNLVEEPFRFIMFMLWVSNPDLKTIKYKKPWSLKFMSKNFTKKAYVVIAERFNLIGFLIFVKIMLCCLVDFIPKSVASEEQAKTVCYFFLYYAPCKV